MKRLHPATLLFKIWGAMKGLFFPAIVVFFAAGDQGDPAWMTRMIFFFVGASLVASVLEYISLRYGIVDDQFVIRSGVLFRRVRKIGLNRIQNIHMKQNLIHQVFRVIELRIETAGEQEAEAVLTVLAQNQAATLRDALLRKQPKPEEEAEEQTTLWSSPVRDLMLAGATETRVGYMMALAWLAVTSLEEVGVSFTRILQKVIGDSAGPVFWTVAAVGILFISWLVSIWFTVLAYHDFRLFQSGKQLKKKHGLLTRHESVIPGTRIQVLRVEATLPRRLLGLRQIRVETAGSATKSVDGQSIMVCPLVRERDSSDLIDKVIPGIDLKSRSFESVHRLAIRRGFVRFLLLSVLLTGGLVIPFGWGAAGSIVPLAFASFGLAVFRYRSMGYTRTPDHLFARAGMWNHRTWVIPREAVQSVHLFQSPMQRMLKLATIRIDTAGGSPWGHAKIIDLPLERALDLQRDLAGVRLFDFLAGATL